MMVWSDKMQQKLYLTLFNSQPFCNQRTANGKSFEADSDAEPTYITRDVEDQTGGSLLNQ
jgi:hypothetical protein